MSLPLARPGVQGLSRYCSVYLLSAFSMLLGGWLSIRGSQTPRWDELGFVFSSQLLYQGLLLAALAYLYRVRGLAEEALLLLGILGVFALDVMMVQHLYYGVRGIWMMAALAGAASGLLMVGGAELALRLPPRLVAVAAASVLFIRLGPALLASSPGAGPLLPLTARQTALGFVLAACALPMLIGRGPQESGSRGALPMAAIERWGSALCLFSATLHFGWSGAAFSLPFHVAYLAPLCVLLSPVIESLVPEERRGAGLRRLCDWLIPAGIALSASALSEPLVDGAWARRMALAPLWPTLLLAGATFLFRARRENRPGLVLGAAAVASLAMLGGDLPEALANIVFPGPLQALCVAIVCWMAILHAGPRPAALVLHMLVAAVAAGLADQYDLPWIAVYLPALVWGVLALDALAGRPLPRRARFALGSFVALVPQIPWFFEPGSPARLALAAGNIALLALFAWRAGDPPLRWSAAAGAVALPAGYWVARMGHGETDAGRFFVHLGFAMLLLGVASTLYGAALTRRLREGIGATE